MVCSCFQVQSTFTTHFATQFGGSVTADDFESRSRAAAAGGITSFINFAFQERGGSLRER